MKWPILFCFLFSNVYAEGVHPKPAAGWVEMNSIHPVILTWAQADPSKKLEDVPTIMVQKYPREEKFVKFIKDKNPSDECKVILASKESEWSQRWCLRPLSVVVLLWKEEAQTKTVREILRNWIMTHE